MHAIIKKLQGGDRRSIGKVDEVVDQVLGSTPLFEKLINGLFADQKSPVRMINFGKWTEQVFCTKYPHKWCYCIVNPLVGVKLKGYGTN